MKKILITTLLLFILSGLFASPSIYIQADFNTAYSTNVFSNPLPQNISNEEGKNYSDWLINKQKFPYFKRLDLGFDFSSSFFFSPEGRTGISTKVSIGFPIRTIETKPNSIDASGTWDYESVELKNQHISTFIAMGPVFRGQLGIIDIGIAARFSMGMINFGLEEFIIGFQAEPYMNVFLTNRIYLSAGLTLDAHILRFINDPDKRYEPGYFVTTLTPFIGFGVKIGERG